MRWPHAPYWVWVLVALITTLCLVFVGAEIRDFGRRRFARFMHFNTLDSAKEERIMLDAEIPPTFNSRVEMLRTVEGLKVLGYGVSGNMLNQPDGSIVWLQSIEIPGRGKDRLLVFREVGGKLIKLDDCVYETNSYVISDVRGDGDRLSYVDSTGRTVPVTRIRPK